MDADIADTDIADIVKCVRGECSTISLYVPLNLSVSVLVSVGVSFLGDPFTSTQQPFGPAPVYVVNVNVNV